MGTLNRKVEKGNCLKTLLVCHLTTAHDASDVRIFERECKSIADKSRYSVILVAHGKMPSYPGIRQVSLGKVPKTRIARLIKSQIVSIRSLMTLKPDLWHLHDPELLIFGCILAFMKKKVIWDAHEDYFLQFRDGDVHRTYIPKHFRKLIKNIVLALLRYLDKHAIAIVSATSSISDSYKNFNKGIVGNEARTEDFADCIPSFHNNRILFTGATDEAQCFDEVVKAVSEVPSLILTVAGNEPEPKNMTDARELLGDRFVYLGWLNRSELSKAISKSKIGLITHSNQATNMTNSPNKRFEFSAGGLPCLVTPTSSNIDWVRASSGGIVATGFTARDLAQALRVLNESEILWENMSISTRTWCQEFGSWEKSEAVLLRLYEQSRS